jgi:glycerophosphoryl diester phosphodiesterase
VAAATVIAAVYLINASWLAPEPDGVPRVLAHRGMYQHSRPRISDDEPCSARRIYPPNHPYFENTIHSIQASLTAGASAVEVDVYPVQEGELAVFHDDELECRTDGRGSTGQQTIADLGRLDAAYGYSVDGGKTFPFRGTGIGMIKSLDEVMSNFPPEAIVVDIKSDEAIGANRLINYLGTRGHPTDNRLWVWAEGNARDRLREVAPDANVISSGQAKACVVRYLAIGWTSHVPDVCRGAHIFVPLNLRWAFWGWPNRFLDRMKRAGVEVIMTGNVGEREPGLSRASDLDAVPDGFDGIIMTDRIELIGPESRRRWFGEPRLSSR